MMIRAHGVAAAVLSVSSGGVLGGDKWMSVALHRAARKSVNTLWVSAQSTVLHNYKHKRERKTWTRFWWVTRDMTSNMIFSLFCQVQSYSRCVTQPTVHVTGVKGIEDIATTIKMRHVQSCSRSTLKAHDIITAYISNRKTQNTSSLNYLRHSSGRGLTLTITRVCRGPACFRLKRVDHQLLKHTGTDCRGYLPIDHWLADRQCRTCYRGRIL